MSLMPPGGAICLLVLVSLLQTTCHGDSCGSDESFIEVPLHVLECAFSVQPHVVLLLPQE